MDGKRFIALVLIVFLSLWGALYLEIGLKSYFVLELFVLLLLIIVSVGIFYSICSGKSWAWKALSAFFLISILNSTLLYLGTGSTTPFILTLFVNLAGLAIIVSKETDISLPSEEGIPELPPMPSYRTEERDFADNIENFNFEPESFFECNAKKTEKKKARKKKPAKKKKTSRKKPRKKK